MVCYTEPKRALLRKIKHYMQKKNPSICVCVSVCSLHSQWCDGQWPYKINDESLFLLLYDHSSCFIKADLPWRGAQRSGHIKYKVSI